MTTTVQSQGATAVLNGKQLEKDGLDYLRTKEYEIKTNKRLYWSKTNYYIPDVILDDEIVIEFKFQQVSGSAQNKLSQAVAELQWMSNTIGYKSVLVISGDKLMHVVNNDPAFKLVVMACPDVQIMTIQEFYSTF